MVRLYKAKKKMEETFKKVKCFQANSKEYNRQMNFRLKKCKRLLASNLIQIASQYIEKYFLVHEAKQ